MTDFYIQVLLIATFSLASAFSFKNNSGLMTWHIVCLILCVSWLLLREAAQIMTTKYILWVQDIWNWIDVFQIGLVMYSMVIMSRMNDISDPYRVIVTITSGIVWIEILPKLKNFFFGIAVFVASIQQILIKIVSFMVVTALIVSAFGHMFYLATFDMYCTNPQWFCGTNGLYGTIQSTLYAMLLSSVIVEVVEESPLTTALLYFFGFVIGLFLLNVLIAEISNVFSEVEQKGKIVFWANRLSTLHEIKSITGFFKRYFPEKITNFSNCWQLNPWYWNKDRMYENVFRPRESMAICKSMNDLCDYLKLFFRRLLWPIFLLVWFLLGLTTFGLLWPQWMKEWLFFGDTSVDDEKSEIKGLKDRVSFLEDLNAGLKDKVTNLADLNGELKNTNQVETKLKDKVSYLEEINVELKKRISTLEELNAELKASNIELRTTVKSLTGE